MSVNKHQRHVLVLPEDDANRQIANGFVLELDPSVSRSIQVLPEAGGWLNVLSAFESYHVPEMNRCAVRFMVLLIDFDGNADRLSYATGRVPEHLKDRVFILGALTKPEALKSAGLGKCEDIGRSLAKDCREDTNTIWAHHLLQHNAAELARLRQHVRPILFHST